MKFSVLMSIYYKENPDYFKKSIESVINQTLVPSEIVLVKDGKLGLELENVISYFTDMYPNLFNIVAFEENKGLGIALCEGVKACSYDLIARMDSDDICREDRFEKQIDVFKNNHEVDIVGSYITEFEGNIDNVISIRKVPLLHDDIKIYSKMRNPFNHMSVMFKKDSVIDAGNYKHFLWSEDYYLWVRMMTNNCVMYNIPESLVYARTGTDMFARRGGLKYAKMEYSLQKEMLKLKFINSTQFIKNLAIRMPVRLVPNSIRERIYINILRK